MTELPTLILDQDEGTVVDRTGTAHFARINDRVSPAMEMRPFRSALLLALAAVAAAVIGFLAAWLLHERQAATRLRQELRRVEARSQHLSHRTASEMLSTSLPRPSEVSRLDSVASPDVLEGRLTHAVNLLIENRFSEALPVYRELHEMEPNDPVLADVVTVIEAKLGCDLVDVEGRRRCR